MMHLPRRAAALAAAMLALGAVAAPAAPAPTAIAASAAPALDAVRWLDAAGRPRPFARAALAVLREAAQDGLDPADYAVPDAPAAPAEAAAWSQALTQAVGRYARHLHDGRVDPAPLGFRWPAPKPRLDLPAWWSALAAAAEPDVAAALARLRPGVPPYAALRSALATYRALAAQPAIDLPALPAKLAPGARWAGVPPLRLWLQALGDLSPGTPADPAAPDRYDEALAAAVQAFQRRHGLDDDGVIGRATEAALRVPAAQRVRQIEWALERLRWLPALTDARGLAVNIPTFRLQAWQQRDGASAAGPGMGVIVGKAVDTRTPVMLATLRQVIFRPYWNVPRSILLKEVIPAWQRDPSYLARQDMEIVQGPGDDARVLGTGPEHLEGLRSGALRLRQRPGPRNALGRVKFVFPNDAAVYLHDTPAPALFQRARRDFSHGCVRVEDPAALAQWLLEGTPGWDRARVDTALAGAPNVAVTLARPVPVVLYYLTAVVDPRDPREGRVHFADDLYGHDARLAAALRQRR